VGVVKPASVELEVRKSSQVSSELPGPRCIYSSLACELHSCSAKRQEAIVSDEPYRTRKKKNKQNKQELSVYMMLMSLTQAQALRVAHHRSDALALATNNLGDERVGRKRRAAHDRAVGHTAVGHAQRRVVEVTAVGAAKCVPGMTTSHRVRVAKASLSVSINIANTKTLQFND
jgi:hypothetical protein